MMPAPAILAARGAARVLGTTDAAWPPPTSGRELVRADLGSLRSGASRARTGDLLGATQTLSQLSYSPELVTRSHGNSTALPVSRGLEPKMQHPAALQMCRWNEVAPIDVGAEDADRVDLIGGVDRANVAGWCETARAHAHDDHVAPTAGPLALHAKRS